MRAVTIVFRFVQLVAILPVGLGLANARRFFILLNDFRQGLPWDFPQFATRLAAFSSPTALGMALIIGLELILRQRRRVLARALRFPQEPWLWNPMWADRRIRLSNRSAVAVCLWSLGIFGFVIVPVGLWMKAQKPEIPIYIVLGIVALFLLALMRMTWLNRQWGQSELDLLTLPGVIGGPFRGTVILSAPLPEGTALRVTLNCTRQRTVRLRPSGESRTITDTIWQDQKILVTAPSMSRPNGIAIPCSFAIPFSCEPTSLDTIAFSTTPDPDPDEHVSYSWQLSVGMKDPQDLRQATFEIPVFRTQSSSANFQEDGAADEPYLEPVDVQTFLESLPFEQKNSSSGRQLCFRTMRGRDLLLMLVFALALTAGVWAIFYYVSMPIALFAAFLPGALAIFSYGALVQGLTWKAEIEISANSTTITAGYPWSRQRYEYPRGKLPRLECRAEIRRQGGSTYSVQMNPAEGAPCDLVRRLESQQIATAVRDWLMTELGKI